MKNQMITSFELTISASDYERLKSISVDFGFEDSLPVRKNIFVSLGSYTGLVETPFDIPGPFYLDNLSITSVPSITKPDEKTLTIVGTPAQSIEKAVNHLNKSIKDYQPISKDLTPCVVISGGFDQDISDELERAVSTYLEGKVNFGEITKRFDTSENMMSILDGVEP